LYEPPRQWTDSSRKIKQALIQHSIYYITKRLCRNKVHNEYKNVEFSRTWSFSYITIYDFILVQSVYRWANLPMVSPGLTNGNQFSKIKWVRWLDNHLKKINVNGTLKIYYANTKQLYPVILYPPAITIYVHWPIRTRKLYNKFNIITLMSSRHVLRQSWPVWSYNSLLNMINNMISLSIFEQICSMTTILLQPISLSFRISIVIDELVRPLKKLYVQCMWFKF